MKNFLLFFLFFTGLMACNQNNDVKLDLPLEIINSDTTFLNVGSIQAPFGRYRMTPSRKNLIIHHARKAFWFDMDDNKISKSIDFDTTSIMPEQTLLNVHYDEKDSSLYLFFPARNQIVWLDSDFEIIEEIKLESPKNHAHRYIPYGNVFYLDPDKNSFYIGIMSDESGGGGHGEFLSKSKFIGKFDRKSGEIENLFGGFSDQRISDNVNALSEGIYTVDFYKDDFFLREAIGSNEIQVFAKNSDPITTYEIGTGKTDLNLIPYDGGEIAGQKMSDNFYTLKILNDTLIGSNLINHFNQEHSNQKHEGLLLLEDIKNYKSYSISTSPFQRLVGGDDKNLYLIRNHPTKEDLILVRLEYRLGTN
ncbi:hypothetical protein [Algoriphagus hitonicola]|uniref:Uncharacterized protein n=1 Tax=Algoriphagus hitonicola TaxID=435880 RepID=A0A1I2UK19_9BACT|nr:hypothetical protein [Algoriphagus hitonicola]SFG75186.1 hypothetical protein SAMN04487988_107188 [Algoriphagus hitonicola]